MTSLAPQQQLLPATAATASSSRPWVEHHRPQSLSDVVAHEEILGTLRRLMASNNLPHLLFYGPPGTGKTSTIQATCRELYGSKGIKGNVLEMNASDDRGIDVVRNVIKDFASTGQIFFQPAAKPPAAAAAAAAAESTTGEENGTSSNNNKPTTQQQQQQVVVARPTFKMVILDEADQMSGEAQAALRRVIEQYTRNVRFVILCNHVNKILPALQSRCTRFRFSPVKLKQMQPRLEAICNAENAKCTPKGLEAAFKLSGGDMRRCVNMMQAAVLAHGSVEEETVYRAAGYPTPAEVSNIVSMMLTQDFASAHKQVSGELREKGLSATDLIKEMHPLVQRMQLPPDAKCHCYKELADIEYNLSAGSSESIAVAAILATFQLVREYVTSLKKD